MFSAIGFLQIKESVYDQANDRLFDYVQQARDEITKRDRVVGTPSGDDDANCREVNRPDVVQVTPALPGQKFKPDEFECYAGLTVTDLPPLPEPRALNVAETLDFRRPDVAADSVSMLVVRSEIAPDPGGTRYRVLAATPIGDAEATINRTRLSLLVGALIATGLAVAVATLAARRGLRSLGEVQRAAEYVAESEDLGVRLVERGPDEIRGLAGSMNQMLERLQSSSARLNTALEEQRRFAQDASHELRTPLTAIRGHIELMQRYELPEAERETVMGEMGDAAERMKRLVEGLLQLARTEGRGGAADEVSLNDILMEVATSDEEGPFFSGVKPLTIVADHEQIRGVFTNLTENGRRYGERIQIFARSDGEWAVVEVQDDGPGIATADRERVFDRFYRAPGLRSTPGSGLGLAIARQAVSRAGGTIRVMASDRGARFEVRLPLAPEAGRPERPPGVLPVGAYDEDDATLDPPPGVEQSGGGRVPPD